MTGVAKNTVSKLLVELGEACSLFHDTHVRNVSAKRNFNADGKSGVVASGGTRASQKRTESKRERGSVWTWTAIDADSKLIVSYVCGGRRCFVLPSNS